MSSKVRLDIFENIHLFSNETVVKLTDCMNNDTYVIRFSSTTIDVIYHVSLSMFVCHAYAIVMQLICISLKFICIHVFLTTHY